MSNEIVVSLKGRTGQDPWVVVHGESAEEVDQLLDSLTGDLLAKFYTHNQFFQNVQAAAPLAPSPSVQQSSSAAPQPQPAAPAQPTAWQPPEVPQYQPPAAVAPTAPTEGSGAGLPNGVSVWTAPSSKKPEYTSVYFSYPFISDAAGRKALQEDFKNQGWAKPYDTNAKPWVYEASKSSFSEADARALFTKYAVLFG